MVATYKFSKSELTAEILESIIHTFQSENITLKIEAKKNALNEPAALVKKIKALEKDFQNGNSIVRFEYNEFSKNFGNL